MILLSCIYMVTLGQKLMDNVIQTKWLSSILKKNA